MANKILILLLTVFLVTFCKGIEQKENNKDTPINKSSIDTLEMDLQKRYDSHNFPGFAVSIFTKDSVYLKKGFGYSNIKSKKKYTPQTIQMIASVSKTFVGVSLMKVLEMGKLNLDDNINDYLPFEVKNPYFPKAIITIRQLAMHTSGINDSLNYNKSYLFESKLDTNQFGEAWHALIKGYNQNEPLELGVFLRQIFSKNGAWYSEKNFHKTPPGESYDYSNLGVSLLAYIIENITGTAFDRFSEEQIIEPLNMTATAWKLQVKQKENQTTYYQANFEEYPDYKIITYPDGGLYSNVEDLTKFLQEMIKAYEGESRLLSKESFQKMVNQIEGFPDGICWDLSIPCCIGHAGNDFGTSTLMYFEPSTGLGRILFANISLDTEKQEEEFYGIFNDLFKYSFK
ncbi:MAG: serine hydrolase domain-containing protein [Saprospiraceae bacterium]